MEPGWVVSGADDVGVGAVVEVSGRAPGTVGVPPEKVVLVVGVGVDVVVEAEGVDVEVDVVLLEVVGVVVDVVDVVVGVDVEVVVEVLVDVVDVDVLVVLVVEVVPPSNANRIVTSPGGSWPKMAFTSICVVSWRAVAHTGASVGIVTSGWVTCTTRAVSSQVPVRARGKVREQFRNAMGMGSETPGAWSWVRVRRMEPFRLAVVPLALPVKPPGLANVAPTLMVSAPRGSVRLRSSAVTVTLRAPLTGSWVPVKAAEAGSGTGMPATPMDPVAVPVTGAGAAPAVPNSTKPAIRVTRRPTTVRRDRRICMVKRTPLEADRFI